MAVPKKKVSKQRRRKRRGAQKAEMPTVQKCPKCGADMRLEKIADVEVEKCPDCGGIFFDRGELETLLLRQEGDKRGFFRKLLGFSEGG